MEAITTNDAPAGHRSAASPDSPGWATGRRFLWSFVALVGALVALNVTQAAVFGHHDAPLLDLRLGYTHGEVVELFGAYGAAGRRAYAVALAADTVYPLALLAAVVLGAARAFGRRRWLWLAPWGFAVFDIVENGLFAAMLASYPDIPSALVTVAAPITVIKLACFVPTVVIGLASAAVLTRRRLARARR